MNKTQAFTQEFRTYFLPIGTKCSPNCRFCSRAGCRNSKHRGLDEIFSILDRAALASYTNIEFSAELIFRSEISRIFEYCKKIGLSASLQLDWHDRLLIEKLRKKETFFTNFLLESTDVVKKDCLSEGDSFSLYPLRVADTMKFLGEHQHIWKNIFLCFPPFSESWPSITVREVHFLIQKIKKALPGFMAQPPRGREVWDPRIDPNLCLEADLNPAFSSVISNENLDFSFIIPSFNSKFLLKNVIHHLIELDYPAEKFEILIVDDGSSDGTLEYIQNFLAPEKGFRNFSYFYFPRPKERKRGDGSFRAGIARNQGAKHAKGRILCFLDSDIIVPKNYLLELTRLHKNFDLVQNTRLHLKNKNGNELQKYEFVNPKNDTYILEEKYWGKLFQTEDWSTLPFFWKYTCTYSLSVSKELFVRAGCFKKTFVYYGFEDTDFGYRLWKLGARFHLSKIITYHLETSEDRTEYKRSNFERHFVLSKTAKVFFLNNLDSDVFLHFYSMMGGEKGPIYYLKKGWARLAPR
jgi:glycosyltransferase involved in cell wall biosynthesis